MQTNRPLTHTNYMVGTGYLSGAGARGSRNCVKDKQTKPNKLQLPRREHPTKPFLVYSIFFSLGEAITICAFECEIIKE